ncbi:MAG: hypothetical protein OXQ29_00320 [Rhodospirillaceae bacterium]|nr:hypothetical protein [Rhodospirillaceae bacterium]
MRRAVRPSKRRARGNRHISLSVRDSEWAVVSRNAAKLGLSKARYLTGLVEREAAGEEDKGPFVALSPEEQRAQLEAVRAIHALLLEDARDPAPAPRASEPTRAARAGAEPSPDAAVPKPPEAAPPDAPDDPAPRQPRLL